MKFDNDGEGMEKFATINPTTEEIIQEYVELSESEIDAKIELASKVFREWSSLKIQQRCELLKKVSDELIANRERIAELITLEMGKPLKQSYAEVDKCAWVCNYYAENAENHLSDISIPTEMQKSYVAFIPLGTVLAIMPWNFPFWQVFRFAAPSLVAGNTGLLKHSRNTMGCAIEIEKVFLNAGFPEGVFQNLVIGSRKVEKVIKDARVKAVTLTGSTPVGKDVAGLAGFNLKKTVLELGGSDPYIILKDAPLEVTVETCVTARLINNGQSCIAAKRFIVEKPIFDDFVSLFVKRMASKKLGNPFELDTELGPLARSDLRIDLQSQVERSIQLGDDLLLGGNIPDGIGYFYPATVVLTKNHISPVFSEETFGPVASIISADNEMVAIELANSSPFGLGAGIFTSDIEKGEAIARNKLEAGCCFVNDFVKSDPRLPFGGIKESGYGRELSIFGIREFVNIKTVCVK
ncbi:MAG: NAD-dependent succinate-semialdehyde dehydrogenase [Ignavibacteria bacterium]|nr:NAD-dependent succinate-semialdehyde dehydrogenase [Ignavibacteria bacterium]